MVAFASINTGKILAFKFRIIIIITINEMLCPRF